jgi:transcription termination factor Rho
VPTISHGTCDNWKQMDDLVYEEFKGTGNMELHLDELLQIGI